MSVPLLSDKAFRKFSSAGVVPHQYESPGPVIFLSVRSHVSTSGNLDNII